MALFHAIWMILLVLVAGVISARHLTEPAPRQIQAEKAPAASPANTDAIASEAASSAFYGPHLDFEHHCQTTLPPTQVEVELAPLAVFYDFSSDIDTLSRYARSDADGVILGLTKNGLGAQFSWHMNLIEDPIHQRACMRPHLRMQVADGVQHVYVAREFERGGCAFNEVLEHEHTHALANRDQLALSALELRGTLKRVLGNRVFYGTRQELTRQLTEAVNEHWLPMARLKFSQASPKHAEIDSEQGYRDVLSRCEGEFARVLRSLRPHG